MKGVCRFGDRYMLIGGHLISGDDAGEWQLFLR